MNSTSGLTYGVNASKTEPAAQPISVKAYYLTALYIVVPLCAILVILDITLFNRALQQNYLPSSPEAWLIWAIVFETPHIIASFFSFADKEYFQHYKNRLVKAVIVFSGIVVLFTIIAPAILPSSLARLVFIAFTAFVITYTMYHVLSQQLGVAVSLMKIRPGKLYEPFRWSATLAGTFMYILAISSIDQVFVGIFQTIAVGFIVLSCILGFLIGKQSKSRQGFWYLYNNIFMLIAVYAFLHLGYGVFVLLVPRFVHDLTAFYIYAVHDRNRNQVIQHNYIYCTFSFVSPLVICPALAIILSLAMEQQAWLVAPLLVLGLLHYYVEGFIWRGKTLHRRHVSFS